MEIAIREVKRFKEKHKRLPKKEEYDQIAENIYAQLEGERRQESEAKQEERLKGRASQQQKPRERPQRKGQQKTGPEIKSEISSTLEQIKKLEVSDLFEESEKKKGTGEKKKDDEFDELSLDFGSTENEEIEPMDSSEETEKCQNCGKEMANPDEILYCPECGTAYCRNCAKRVEKLQDRIRYYCPKCGKFTEK